MRNSSNTWVRPLLWLCSQIALLLNYAGNIIQYMIMPYEGPPVAAELTMFVPDWNIMGPGLMRSVSGGENTRICSGLAPRRRYAGVDIVSCLPQL